MNKEKMLKELSTNGFMLCVYTSFNDDKDVVLVAVKANGLALTFASDRLQNDKDVVLVAIMEDPNSLKFASAELKNDKDIILAAIKKDGLTIRYASDELKSDRNLVLTAMNNNPKSLRFSDSSLHVDLELIKILKTSHDNSSIVYDLDDYVIWYEKIIENFDIKYEQKLMEDSIPINSEIKNKQRKF